MPSHWPLFRKFIRAEKAVGGPDCQFTLMFSHVERIHGTLDDERDMMWLIGCYGAHHCAMPAYEVWYNFDWRRALAEPKKLRAWLKEHWHALPVRREMRSHRMLDKRWKCLMDFAEFTRAKRFLRKHNPTFDDMWTDSQKCIKFYGRYMSIKVLELMHRSIRPDMPSYDIRAAHAWSPRAAMGLLYPKQAYWLADRKRNDVDTVMHVEEYGSRIYDDLHDHGIAVSPFELQGLLCNYKEMLYGRFYPGAGHDEDMEYMRVYAQDFDSKPWWTTRKRIFNHKYLGEIAGWDGLRKDEGARWMQMRVDRKLHLPSRGS